MGSYDRTIKTRKNIMGEFKDASKWQRSSSLMSILGFVLMLFAFNIHMSTAGTNPSGKEDVLAMTVIAILAQLGAFYLAIITVTWDEVKEKKVADILHLVLALVGGFFMLIAGGILGNNATKTQLYTKFEQYGVQLPVYFLSAFCQMVAGILSILRVAGCCKS